MAHTKAIRFETGFKMPSALSGTFANAKDHRCCVLALKRAVSMALLAIVTLLPVAARAGDYVARNGQLLSLNFQDEPLKLILERLQQDGQITVKIAPSLWDRKVTVKISNMAVDAALASLFKSAA